jgi:hypothetical protein
MQGALRNDDAKLSQMTAQRIDRLGALAHQKIARAKHNGAGLPLFRFHFNEPHARSLRSLADRLGVRLAPLE